MTKTIDVIVTIRDEEDFLPIFTDAIFNLKIPEEYKLQLLFIEDSSKDRTVEILEKLCRENENVSGYSLKKGFGQIPAINWGIQKSRADYIIMMDIDGAHPVNCIPVMIQEIEGGADIAQGSREVLANRSFFRKFFSSIFNSCMYLLTGFDSKKQNVYFRMITKDVKNLILNNYRIQRFLRINPSSNKLMRISYVPFSAEERIYGESKFNLKRLIKLSVLGALSVCSILRFCMFILVLFLLLIVVGLFLTPIISIIIGLFTFYLIVLFGYISTTNTTDKLELKKEY